MSQEFTSRFDVSAVAHTKALLAEPKRIAIVTHKFPDGDAAGSSLGFGALLRKMGHDVTVILPSGLSMGLSWLDDDVSHKAAVFCDAPEDVTKKVTEADLIFCLDFNDAKLTGEMQPILEAQARAPKIMLDHHQNPKHSCDILLSVPGVSSTAELVADLARDLNLDNRMDGAIAEKLYTGIMTDSGGFRHPEADQKTYETLAWLRGFDFNHSACFERVYDQTTIESMRFQSDVISRAEIVGDPVRAAIMTITKADQERCGYKSQIVDQKVIANLVARTKGVDMCALFYEEADFIGISFRSKGAVNVEEIARQHFEGGGHVPAAGGRSRKTMTEAVADFKALVQTLKYIE